MQVQSNMQPRSFNKKNNISFSGQRLLPLVVKTRAKFINGIANTSGAFREEPCFFTRITDEDRDYFSKMANIWSHQSFSSSILKDFETVKSRKFDGMPAEKIESFYMVEAANETEPYNRVKALAEVCDYGPNMVVTYLQSASKFNKIQDVIGGGSALMYGLSRTAEQQQKKALSLWSVDDAFNWYKKIGMKRQSDMSFTVKAEDYDTFQKGLERRLGINRSEFGKVE